MTEPHRFLDIPSIDSEENGEHGWKYRAVHRLEQANRIQINGHVDETPSVRELLAKRANQIHHENHWVLAVQGPEEDPRAVGWASVSLPLHEDLDKAELYVCVDPEARRQGIGSALLSWCEELVAPTGRALLFVEATYGASEDHEPYLDTPEGARVPSRCACVSFAMGKGYELAHAARRSVLDLPVGPETAARLMAETSPYTEGYRLHTWFCEIPLGWRDSFARLKEAFSRDAPMGAVDFEEEVWDHDRVDQMVREIVDQGNVVLMTASEHVATGELVGFTELRWPDDPGWESASQYFTIVSGEHRGHRLGMWMKLVNAAEMASRQPTIRRVHTDNAHENAPMLDINIKMGFRPDGGIALMMKRTD